MKNMNGLLLTFVLIEASAIFNSDAIGLLEPAETLECHRRLYSYRVTQTDDQGKQCWDNISVMSCWGRCDSKEISDWRFPYKRSYHPVCMHATRRKSMVNLRHCEAGVAAGTERYVYLEAQTCRCQACTSSDTSCEGVRYRGHRTQTVPFMALDTDDAGFGNDEENFIE